MGLPTRTEASPPEGDAEFTLQTLGEARLRIVDPGTRLPGADRLPQGKSLALLTYLHCARDRTASREHLIDLLWRDSPPDAARQSLRQTVYRTRAALGAGALAAPGDALTLALPLDCDRDRFLLAVREGRPAAAVGIYQGPFFPGFAAPGAVGFEQWADLERAGLRTAFINAATAAVDAALDRGNHSEAARLAQRARDIHPELPEAWRLLLRALVSAESWNLALLEAEAADLRIDAEDWPADPALTALIARARARRPGGTTAASAHPAPDLVGREGVFASLLGAWRRTSSGRGGVVAVQGAAGLGKTRLAREFHRRLLQSSARLVMVQAHPADRDLPFSLVATLVEALAGLPGAVGISPGSVTALVDLAPALSSVFPGHERRRLDQEDILRVRALALAELLQSVSDETPVAVVVDDLHWADEASRKLLATVGERLAGQRVLMVLALRPMRGGWSCPMGTDLLELAPLTLAQVEALAASLATGEEALLSELARLLHEVSSGVPLLALSAIRLGFERRWLAVEGGRWAVAELGQMRAALARGSVLDHLLQHVPPDSRELLLALAVTGRPLSEEVLTAVRSASGSLDGLPVLEQRGLVARVDPGWDISHDRLAEAVLASVPQDARDAMARRVGLALLEREGASPRTLRLAGQLLHRSSPSEAAFPFLQWLGGSRRRALWRDPAAAAAEFLGEEATIEDARRLGRTVPRLTRWTRGRPELAAGIGLALLAGTVAGTARGLEVLLEPPARAIVVAEPPNSQGFLFARPDDPRASGNPPRAPVPVMADFRNADGNVTRNAPRMATVRLVGDTGVRLSGTLEQPVRNGRVEFPDLTVEGVGFFHLEVTAGELPAGRSNRLVAVTRGNSFTIESQRILDGLLNGQRVDSTHREIVVEPGAPIEGHLVIRSFTAQQTAARLVGAVALWGDRTTNWMPLMAVDPHGEKVFRVPLAAPKTGWRFTAPRERGTYWLLVVVDVETGMRFMASRTNWTLGEPVWFDGDDLADLGPEQLRRLDEEGLARWPRLFHDDTAPGGTRSEADQWVVGTVIRVRVE